MPGGTTAETQKFSMKKTGVVRDTVLAFAEVGRFAVGNTSIKGLRAKLMKHWK